MEDARDGKPVTHRETRGHARGVGSSRGGDGRRERHGRRTLGERLGGSDRGDKSRVGVTGAEV